MVAGVALALIAGVAAVAGAFTGAPEEEAGGGRADAAPSPAPPELPRGGRQLLPEHRVVAYYGAPQADELGALGHRLARTAPRAGSAARPAATSARQRPCCPRSELIAVIANADPGDDGMYRTRQPDAVIRRYLRAARRHKMLLMLDIQPGRSDFFTETTRLERWLREPDVGLALDPEWRVTAPARCPVR